MLGRELKPSNTHTQESNFKYSKNQRKALYVLYEESSLAFFGQGILWSSKILRSLKRIEFYITHFFLNQNVLGVQILSILNRIWQSVNYRKNTSKGDERGGQQD